MNFISFIAKHGYRSLELIQRNSDFSIGVIRKRKPSLRTNAHIEIFLFVYLTLQHIGNALKLLLLVQTTWSQERPNRRLIDTHRLANLDVGHPFILQSLGLKNQSLIVLGLGDRL